jgi:hypothetical protein
MNTTLQLNNKIRLNFEKAYCATGNNPVVNSALSVLDHEIGTSNIMMTIALIIENLDPYDNLFPYQAC